MNIFIYFFHLHPRRPGVSAGGREEEGGKRNQHIGEVPSKSRPLPSPPRAARRPRFDSRPCFQLRCKCIDFRCCWVGCVFFFFPLSSPSLLPFLALWKPETEERGGARTLPLEGTERDWKGLGEGTRTDGQTDLEPAGGKGAGLWEGEACERGWGEREMQGQRGDGEGKGIEAEAGLGAGGTDGG